MWTVEQVKTKLNTNQKWVERGLVALYKYQTTRERASKTTIVHNEMGFSAVDAHIGSYLAEWVLSGKTLNGKWVEKGRKIVLKYAIQLTGIANAKAKLEERANVRQEAS
jgi:hypothetical protein